MPRPKHEPTAESRAQCTAFSIVGTPHHDCALLMGISIKTLLKYYPDELRLGKLRANANMGGTLYRMGMSGKIPAATIFWMKSQAGWRDQAEVQPGNTIFIFDDPTQRPPGYGRKTRGGGGGSGAGGAAA